MAPASVLVEAAQRAFREGGVEIAASHHAGGPHGRPFTLEVLGATFVEAEQPGYADLSTGRTVTRRNAAPESWTLYEGSQIYYGPTADGPWRTSLAPALSAAFPSGTRSGCCRR